MKGRGAVRRLTVFGLALALLGLASTLALAAPKRHHHRRQTFKPDPCMVGHKAKAKHKPKRAHSGVAARRHHSTRHKKTARSPCRSAVRSVAGVVHQANGPYPGNSKPGETNDEGKPMLPAGPYRPRRGPALAVPSMPAATTARVPRRGAFAAAADPTAPVEIGAEVDPATAGLGPAAADQESSEAIVGNLIFFTSNWRTGYSTDFGRTFTELKAEAAPGEKGGVFPEVAGGFCCDQVVMYAPEVDRVFWIIQYNNEEKTGENIIRVAWASPAAIAKDAVHAWSYLDLSSKEIVGTGKCFDQPHAGLAQGYLLMAINQCTGGRVFKSVMFELTLSTLDKPEVQYSYAISNPVGAIPARGQGNLVGIHPDIFYFVGQKSSSELTVFHWKAGETTVYHEDIPIPTIATQGWASPTPGGANWMARQSESQGTKVTGATLAGGQLWAAWSAGRETEDNEGNLHPVHAQPAIEGTQITLNSDGSASATNTPVTYYNNSFAVAMPDLATNAHGEVGLSFEQGGGGTAYPRHAVGIVTGTPQFAFDVPGSADSSTGPGGSTAGDPAGDYTTVGVEYPATDCFTSSGVAHTTAEKAPSPRSLPRVLTFARRGVEGCTAPIPGFAPTPAPSHLTMSCPAQITAGESIGVSGSLTPAHPGVPIKVQFTRPNGSTAEIAVNTDAASNYSTSDLTAPGETGTWRVVASWAGDSKNLQSSAGCAVHAVTPPTPEQLPSTISIYCPTSVLEEEGVPIFQAGETATTKGGVYLTSPPRPFKAANVPVIVEYVPENPSDTAFRETVMTDGSGEYTDSVQLPAEFGGYWDIVAYWNGDAEDQGATSGTCRVYQHEAIH
jgi:hypothetical protein